MKAFGTVRCPWCGAEFDTGGIEEAGACVVECDRCGFEFEVESELLISCEAGIPAELEGCDRCGCWDIDGFCGWGHAYECGVGACDVPDCPPRASHGPKRGMPKVSQSGVFRVGATDAKTRG